jgi:hypothetical protein
MNQNEESPSSFHDISIKTEQRIGHEYDVEERDDSLLLNSCQPASLFWIFLKTICLPWYRRPQTPSRDDTTSWRIPREVQVYKSCSSNSLKVYEVPLASHANARILAAFRRICPLQYRDSSPPSTARATINHSLQRNASSRRGMIRTMNSSQWSTHQS